MLKTNKIRTHKRNTFIDLVLSKIAVITLILKRSGDFLL